MATGPARPSSIPMRGGAAPLLLLALAAALNVTPLRQVAALDLQHGTPIEGPAERSAPPEDFPGSAYFLAEDAFVLPAPAAPAEGTAKPESASPHVFTIDPGPAALSMPIRPASPLDQARALQCLTNAIFYEAGNEPEEGQRAVAQVVLNRVASGRWPTSICGAIYQGGERSDRKCQFTFSCDGSMARPASGPGWLRARAVASRALAGETFAPVGLATYYHTLAVHPPWADQLTKAAIVGAHIFYRLPGAAGSPTAYRNRYAGAETAQPGPYALAPPEKASAVAPAIKPATTLIPPADPMLFMRPAPAPGLPRSGIRPEYRDSGRVIHP